MSAYCDFYKSADLRPMKAVVEAMHDELRREAGFLPAEQLRTIYFGGGTPSLLPPEELEEFIAHAAELFDCTALEECTVEANPDDLTPDYLRRLARTRVDRLSIGVQSFDDGELRLMNRRHTADAARKAVRQAQEAGFGNVTVDLIFGVPGFGAATLARNLRETVALGVQHVSAYHLTVEAADASAATWHRAILPVTEETSEEVHSRCTARSATPDSSTTKSRTTPCPAAGRSTTAPIGAETPIWESALRHIRSTANAGAGPSPTSGATWPAATATNRSA